VEFDRFSVALLVRRPDAPVLDDEAAAALQDAHMAYLSDLHDAGHLLAAGPVGDDEIAGLSILSVPPDEARALKEADPAVQAGCYTLTVAEWLVPGGAIAFTPTHLPRSMAEVLA
jgi:uncharacterized protein